MQPSQWFHFAVLSIYHLMIFIYAEPLQGYNILPAEPHEFPFIASLGLKMPMNSRAHFCAGTLVSIIHVLTAEHCLINKTPPQIDVIIGATDWQLAEFKYNIYSWITYDRWIQYHGKTAKFKKNDVAVIKLTSAVNQESITPVRFTELNNFQLHRTTAIIVGWGVANDGTRGSVLQKMKVIILTIEECQKRYELMTNQFLPLHERTLCTVAHPHVLLSMGDSGGPLLSKDHEILGISSSTRSKTNWGNFSDEFINKYKINFHPSIDFYKEFILNVTTGY